MPQYEMYPAIPNSPMTTLSNEISDTADTILVNDASKLPDAPNLATLGAGEDAETILYEAKDGNYLQQVTRGFQGTAKTWPSGTQVARMFTAWDYDALRQNLIQYISDLGLHLDDIMPHQFKDLKSGKTYRYGYQTSNDGKPQLIYEEVTE